MNRQARTSFFLMVVWLLSPELAVAQENGQTPDVPFVATRHKTHAVYRWSGRGSPGFSGLATSPKDDLVALDFLDGSFAVLNPKRELVPFVARGHRGQYSRVSALAFSPDGKTLATGGRDQDNDPTPIRFWDVNTMKETDSFRSPGNVWSLAYSRDGMRLAAHCDFGNVLLLDPIRMIEVSRIKVSERLEAVALSPDGKVIATASARTIRLWDAEAGRETSKLPGVSSIVYSLAISPDGKWLAAGCDDKSIIVWNLRNSAVSKRITGHVAPIVDLMFSPDGTRLAACVNANPGRYRNTTIVSRDRDYSPEVKVWDVEKGTLIADLIGHGVAVNRVAFGADNNTVLTTGRDGTLRIWNLAAYQIPMAAFGSGQARVRDVAVSSSVVATATNQGIFLWETATGREIRRLPTTDTLQVVLASDEKSIFATTRSNRVIRVDTTTGAETLLWKGTQLVGGIAVSSNGSTLAIGSNDGTLKLIDLTSKDAAPVSLAGHGGLVGKLAFSPKDPKILAAAGSHSLVRIWNVDGKELVAEIPLLKLPANSLAFSPDGEVLAVASGWPIRLYDSKAWTEFAALTPASPADKTHDPHARAMAFSPDGKRLLVGGDATPIPTARRAGVLVESLFLLNADNGKILNAWTIDPGNVRRVHFLNDQRALYLSGDVLSSVE